MDNSEEKLSAIKNQNTRNINDTSWVINVFAYNEQTNQPFMLPAEKLLQIQFKNSIEQVVPELKMLYRDDGFEFSNFLRFNGLKFYVMIQAGRFSQDLEPIKYSGEYILVNFELKLQKKDYMLYQLTCSHADLLKLVQNVNYSTNKQTLTGQVSPYKIILDINNIIQNPFDSNYVETTRKIDFISSQNSSALEIINYCLKMRCR